MDNDSDDNRTEISSCCDDKKGSKDLDLVITSTSRSGDENLDLAYTQPERFDLQI